MANLQDNAFLRIHHIVGDAKAEPPIEPLIPIGKSTWWAGVKSGKFPQPVKLGARTTAWRVEDIRKLMDSFAGVAQ
jgi:predicted DNA-binding transcriptional regulator AlpA